VTKRGPKNDGSGRENGGRLGTFAGVFTPSILTILGIILFLRLGYVVGAAGLPRALLIILMANAISILTSVSLSAIATNLHVKGGGDYYLISRTLGVEYGGALGVVLFLAQSVSIGFYCIGFGEVLTMVLGRSEPWFAQAVAAGAVAVLFVLAWLGADLATRFQYVVMTVLFSAIVVFLIGGMTHWSTEQLTANMSPAGDVPFWAIFALFFPAVTGFTQGVSMSGDLKNPGKSLPFGTFLAVGLSLVIYVVIAIVFAAAAPGRELVTDLREMRQIASVAWLVDAGVIAATLSSALASFLGAPRILQSLARDRVFPFLTFFAAGHPRTNNPRRAVVLSAILAIGTVTLGSLDAIAPIVSMFFLISYGLLNYATYFEARANSPSFRPRFRFFNARVSLLGALACLAAMLAINPTAGAIAAALLFAVHQYISRTVAVGRWADSDRSRRFQRVRDDLLAISRGMEHSRYWRPVLIAFSNDADRRERLLRFASWLEGGSGITTAVRVVEGEGVTGLKLRDQAEIELRSDIDERGLPAYARAIVARDLQSAIPIFLQAHGLGPLRPNTVLLNWRDARPGTEEIVDIETYVRHLRLPLRFGNSLIILAADSDDFERLAETPVADRRIDVWHRENATGNMMMLLAYLMKRTDEWSDARIRLFTSPAADESRDQAMERVQQMLAQARIPAEPQIVDTLGGETIVDRSTGSSVVFMPMRLTDRGPTGVNGESLDELTGPLGIVAMVLARQDIDLDSEPEGEQYAEVADALDAVDGAKKTASKADKEAVRAEKKQTKVEEKLEQARGEGVASDELHQLESEAEAAENEAARAKRRAAKARAKAESAVVDAEKVLGRPLQRKDDAEDQPSNGSQPENGDDPPKKG
jgi:amino acid transporter